MKLSPVNTSLLRMITHFAVQSPQIYDIASYIECFSFFQHAILLYKGLMRVTEKHYRIRLLLVVCLWALATGAVKYITSLGTSGASILLCKESSKLYRISNYIPAQQIFHLLCSTFVCFFSIVTSDDRCPRNALSTRMHAGLSLCMQSWDFERNTNTFVLSHHKMDLMWVM
jgi:hypothetical protein